MPRLSTDEIIIILEVFEESIRDGLDIKYILEILEDIFSQKNKSKVITEIGRGIFAYGSIADGFKGILDSNLIEAIKFGDEKGQLDATLGKIREVYELKRHLTAQIRKALAYPAGLLAVIFAMFLGLFLFFMPVIEKTFKGIDPKKIPELNKALFSISHLLRDNVVLLVIAIIVIAVMSYILVKKYSQSILFSLPIIKHIMMTQENAMAFQLMAVFCKTEINIQKSFKSIGATMRGAMKNVFLYVADRIAEGRSISDAFSDARCDKNIIVRIKSGEATGKIEDAFEKLSKIEQKNLERRVAIMSKTLYHWMLVTVGLLFVIFYAVTVLPAYKLAGL